MDITSALLTVAEFSRLPQSQGGIRQELHHGELVQAPPVKMLHTRLQRRLLSLLADAVNPAEHGVDKEFPFRPAPEYEVWVADVALFSLTLCNQTADDDYFRGVPAIVIEVLSPTNTPSEMLEREEACLQYGGREFWLVDPQRESVKVVHAGGLSSIFHVTNEIESSLLSKPIKVSQIFSRE